MMNVSDCRKGDIVLVNLNGNSTDGSTAEHRPAVIISCDTVNANLETIIVCPLVEVSEFSHSRVGATFVPHDLTGLLHDSVVLCLHIVTLNRNRIVKRVSSLPKSLLSSVEESLEFVLDLNHT